MVWPEKLNHIVVTDNVACPKWIAGNSQAPSALITSAYVE